MTFYDSEVLKLGWVNISVIVGMMRRRERTQKQQGFFPLWEWICYERMMRSVYYMERPGQWCKVAEAKYRLLRYRWDSIAKKVRCMGSLVDF